MPPRERREVEPQAPPGSVPYNGSFYTLGDFTYEEQREVRELVRELMEDPAAQILEAMEADMDLIPAMLCVLHRRDDPDYELAAALKVKPADLTEQEAEILKRQRPTRAAKAA